MSSGATAPRSRTSRRVAEIEVAIRRLATLSEGDARPRLRNTALQMIDVMKRIESGAAATREAFEELLRQ